jgi:hypothetical protein
VLRAPFHPVLIALYPVLSYYQVNAHLQPAKVVLAPIIAMLLLAGFVWGACYLMVRNVNRAALLSFLILLFFGHYKYFYWLIEAIGIHWPDSGIGFHKILIISIILCLIIGGIWAIKAKNDPRNVTTILNISCALLIAMPLAGIFWKKVVRAESETAWAGPATLSGTPGGRIDSRQLPDIYHIILDAYGRTDVYADIYGYDNKNFMDFLEDEGFYLARQSRANYAHTVPSFTSFLNMDYLDRIVPDVSKDAPDVKHYFNPLHDNAVFRTLRQHGYEIVVFNSGYIVSDFDPRRVTMRSPNIASLLGLAFLDEFQVGLINLTPIPVVARRLHPLEVRRQYLLHTLDNAGRARFDGEKRKPSNRPRFFFAHIGGPHGPHLFTEEGKPLGLPETTSGPAYCLAQWAPSAEAYIAQHTSYVKYLNKRLKDMLRRILDRAERELVIILQSDHGPRSLCGPEDKSRGEFLRERLSNLTAVYASTGGYDGLYQTVTPVNIYRIIFNTFFDANMNLLPDRSYILNEGKTYDFTDVTDEIAK